MCASTALHTLVDPNSPTKAHFAVVDSGSFVLPYDFHLLRALSLQGAAIDFYFSRTTANMELIAELRSCRNISLNSFDVSSTVTPRFNGFLNYLLLVRRLLRNATRYDAVIVQFSVLPLFDLLILSWLKGKLWLTVHEDTGAADRLKASPFLERLWHRADRLIFVSEAVRARFVARRPELEPRTLTIPHGPMPVVPEDDDVVVPTQTTPERVLVFWGLVKPYKGVEFLELVAQDTRSRGLKLEIHGKWHTSLKKTKRNLGLLGVQIHDQFLTTSEVRALLSRPVIFVLPYLQCAQSGVLYTLLHYGCPFVATDVGDIGDFVRGAHLERVLFHTHHMESFFNALEFAIDNYETIRKRLLSIKLEHSWARSAQLLVKTLNGR